MTRALPTIRALAYALHEGRGTCGSCLTTQCADPHRCLALAYLTHQGDPL